MNRFFRSALFPLIVIVLLVYLASQTLMGGSKNERKVTYSQLIDRVETNAPSIDNVVIGVAAAGSGTSIVNGSMCTSRRPSHTWRRLATRYGGARD